MSDGIYPDPDRVFPMPGIDTVTLVKPTVTDPNIIVGDFTYYSGRDFQSRVTHHYDFIGDRLIIGRFCQIASGVEFVMNGANHQMNAATTYPFYTMAGWEQPAPALTGLLERLRWWDRSAEEIRTLIPVLTCSDLEKVKAEIAAILDEENKNLR